MQWIVVHFLFVIIEDHSFLLIGIIIHREREEFERDRQMKIELQLQLQRNEGEIIVIVTRARDSIDSFQ